MQTEARVTRPVPLVYHGAALLFLAAYGLLLLLVVDWIRGLLGLGYGERALLLAIAIVGLVLTYVWLKRLETVSQDAEAMRKATLWLVVAVVLLTFLALFIYRGAAGARAAVAGVSVREAWPVSEYPAWLKPVAVAGNYLRDTWFPTLVGIFIAGAALTFFPAFIRGRLNKSSWSSHLLGVGLAFPNMLCSCCAAPIGGAMYRGGAALSPALAFAVAAPSLNLVTLVLAVLLLPPELALVRMVAGLLISIPLTYMAVAITRRPAPLLEGMLPASDRHAQGWYRPLVLRMNALLQAFQMDVPEGRPVAPTFAEAVDRWLHVSWRIGRVLVPLLVIGYLVVGAIAVLFPPGGTHGVGVWPVALTAFLGTLLMIPTAVEIPMAIALWQGGFPALAAVALVTLPPLSLPSLLVLGSATRAPRTMVAMGLLVFLLGIVTGVFFLWMA